jgi:hypothetical protein
MAGEGLLADLLAEERVEREAGAGVTNSRAGVVSLLT